MILGSLVDAGFPFEDLVRGLKELPLEGFSLNREKVRRGAIAGTKIHVNLEEGGSPFRKPSDLTDLVKRSALPESIRDTAARVFDRLRDAEAAVHGEPRDRVHFHDLGGIDTVVDVVGTLVGLEGLEIEAVEASPIAVGRGFLQCGHGRLPVPPPASVEILKGIPTVEIDVEGEIATPTGCALLAVLCRRFGRRPAMVYESVGYGAGDREIPNHPNLLRLFIGTAEDTGGDRVTVLQTNLDDLSPQILGHVFDRLLSAGALDVWTTPATMKKGRPGTVLSVLAREGSEESLEAVVFAETTTLGIRRQVMERSVLERHAERVETPWGPVEIKVAVLPGGASKWAPEFEECKALAVAAGVPVREVLEAASAAARSRFGGSGPASGA
jgi:uncharacterized protein (TIGR00299 family) protein